MNDWGCRSRITRFWNLFPIPLRPISTTWPTSGSSRAGISRGLRETRRFSPTARKGSTISLFLPRVITFPSPSWTRATSPMRTDHRRLFMNICHRELDNLFACGLVQPADGGSGSSPTIRPQLIATFGRRPGAGPKTADWFRKHKATGDARCLHGVKYLDSPRHKLEVQHYRYRTYIKKLLKKIRRTWRPCLIRRQHTPLRRRP